MRDDRIKVVKAGWLTGSRIKTLSNLQIDSPNRVADWAKEALIIASQTLNEPRGIGPLKLWAYDGEEPYE